MHVVNKIIVKNNLTGQLFIHCFKERHMRKGSAEAETKDGGVNIAKYARCEWKCIARIGAMIGIKLATE